MLWYLRLCSEILVLEMQHRCVGARMTGGRPWVAKLISSCLVNKPEKKIVLLLVGKVELKKRSKCFILNIIIRIIS